MSGLQKDDFNNFRLNGRGIKMSNAEIMTIIQTSGIDKTKAQTLLDKFTGYFDVAAEWERKTKEIIVTDISQVTEMKMAREARLFLGKKRIEVEKTRKILKEESLKEGQIIDSIARILKNLIEPIERELEGKEKFAELKKAEQLALLKSNRIEKIKQFSGDMNLELYNIELMPDDVFDQFYEGIKNTYNKKIEEEQMVELERIAKIKAVEEEQKRLKLENERLKREYEKKQEELRLVNIAAEAEAKRLKDIAAQAAIKSAIETKRLKDIADVEAKTLQDINTALIEKEREKTKQANIAAEAETKRLKDIAEKANAETKRLRDIATAAAEKADAEAKVKKDAETKLLQATDKQKMLTFNSMLHTIQYPVVSNQKAKDLIVSIQAYMEKLDTFIIGKIKEL